VTDALFLPLPAGAAGRSEPWAGQRWAHEKCGGESLSCGWTAVGGSLGGRGVAVGKVRLRWHKPAISDPRLVASMAVSASVPAWHTKMCLGSGKLVISARLLLFLWLCQLLLQDGLQGCAFGSISHGLHPRLVASIAVSAVLAGASQRGLPHPLGCWTNITIPRFSLCALSEAIKPCTGQSVSGIQHITRCHGSGMVPVSGDASGCGGFPIAHPSM